MFLYLNAGVALILHPHLTLGESCPTCGTDHNPFTLPHIQRKITEVSWQSRKEHAWLHRQGQWQRKHVPPPPDRSLALVKKRLHRTSVQCPPEMSPLTLAHSLLSPPVPNTTLPRLVPAHTLSSTSSPIFLSIKNAVSANARYGGVRSYI